MNNILYEYSRELDVPPNTKGENSKEDDVPPNTKDENSREDDVPPNIIDENSREDDVPSNTKDENSREVDVSPNTKDGNPSIFDLPPSTKEEIMAIEGYEIIFVPSSEKISVKDGYVISYDLERKMAKWVLERLTSNHIVGSYLSRDDAIEFEEDEDMSGVISLAAYKHWGKYNYQRGHLAAAANHRYNRKAYNSTFIITNVVPMYGKVNYVLSKIEQEARKIGEKHGSVHIISGPIFRSKRKEPIVVGDATVLVPNDIFKIIVYKEKNKYKVRGYVVENSLNVAYEDISNSKRELEYIEKYTGLKFLPKVADNDKVQELFKNRNKCRRPGCICYDFICFFAFMMSSLYAFLMYSVKVIKNKKNIPFTS